MKKPIFALLLSLVCATVFAKNSPSPKKPSARAATKAFEACYHERSKNIPSEGERNFLDAYLAYLKTSTDANGKKATEKMRDLAKDQGGQFAVNWVSIFEGSKQLCCGGPETCTESFGSVSLKKLLPRVSEGDATAIKLVLTYEKLAKTDGADAEGLQEYLKVIQAKYPKAIVKFNKANP